MSVETYVADNAQDDVFGCKADGHAAAQVEAQLNISNTDSDAGANDASNELSLTSTESKKSVDVNDDSIARAPPVYDAIQTTHDNLENDAVLKWQIEERQFQQSPVWMKLL